MAYCIQKENCLTSEKDDYWRSCVPVIRVTWLRLKYLVKRSTTEETTGKKERKEWLIWSVYQLYGNPVILERIQVERLIPEEFKKKKKVIAFEELPFSRFDRNDRNVLYYLRWLPIQGLFSRLKAKNLPLFCKSAKNQSHSRFRCENNYQYRL